ncbi:MAG: DUF11 domain-containing protein [Lysobacteraceae bacterium]|nr:MAG: DUF11 domain-containing protein [Xanthomonadaceae bacterium]
MNKPIVMALGMCLSGAAGAAEITLQNDSLVDFGQAAIVWGFVAGEKAASWLTSPCDGDLVALQVFWRSPSGIAPFSIQESIDVYRSGTFPEPGDVALQVFGPVMNDNALNEFRYLDENNTLPISVPVVENETVVVAFTFTAAPEAGVDPSVVRDTNGIQPGRNAILADIGASFMWFDASTLGVTGDWVIRAVVDCDALPNSADVSVAMTADPLQYTAGEALAYTITVANAGPAASPSTTIIDTFPSAFESPTWTCTASSGASCTANGTGHLATVANLPVGGSVVYSVSGTIAAGATGTIGNSATAVVGAPANDPAGTNNTVLLEVTQATSDVIFSDGFEPDLRAPRLVPRAGRARGYAPAR